MRPALVVEYQGVDGLWADQGLAVGFVPENPGTQWLRFRQAQVLFDDQSEYSRGSGAGTTDYLIVPRDPRVYSLPGTDVYAIMGMARGGLTPLGIDGHELYPLTVVDMDGTRDSREPCYWGVWRSQAELTRWWLTTHSAQHTD